jgi:hypothetical protein
MNNRDFKIYKDGHKHTIRFDYYSEPLIKSIVHSRQIEDITVFKDFKTISFTATSIKKCSGKPISYDAALQLVSSLARQLKYLIEVHSMCFYIYSLDNLFILDDNKFVYISNEHLEKLTDNSVLIIQPFKEQFVSPELQRITQIPAKVDFRAAYYSLGMMVMHLLSGEEVKGTKLFALLNRCLAEDPCKRSILFI